MGLISEFKEFAMKGNVVDMAVGIIIGGAFGKVVTSLVSDIVMPPVGLLMGGVPFKDLKFVLKSGVEAIPAVPATATTPAVPGVAAQPEVAIMIGAFASTLIDFIILAFVIFMVIKMMNRLIRKREAAAAA